uniref:NADH dehydrogenase [ubiquinone] 1 beta subcomplex subunit 5, mitochondrial n=1 Tax=Panagrellus redivivus TaxID=6233 RepID=A0A7E4VJB2_PANRE
MTIVSKLTPSAAQLVRASLSKLRPEVAGSQIRLSHAHVFRKRSGQLIVNRIKDAAHFYFIAIGILPFFVAAALTHIVYGPCELKDYPTEGPPPHHWQFERTPLRQLFGKYFGISDIEHYERNLAFYERQSILGRVRRVEDRIQHLQGERGDYKGYYYQPVSSQWVDYGRYMANRFNNEYEHHGSYGN